MVKVFSWWPRKHKGRRSWSLELSQFGSPNCLLVACNPEALGQLKQPCSGSARVRWPAPVGRGCSAPCSGAIALQSQDLARSARAAFT